MRISNLVSAAIGLLLAVAAVGQPRTSLRPDKVVHLYPEGQEASTGIVENGVAVTLGPGESNGITAEYTFNERGSAGNVVDPVIELYFPENPNGQMVIVAPGGGYSHLSTYIEGLYVAEWMLGEGVTVGVVHYRMPNGHSMVPLTDMQNAFRYCRAHSAEWRVDQIGVMGFSAGGHLAASTSTLFTDDVTRPDFSILFYPVITLEPSLTHMGTHDSLLGRAQAAIDKEAYLAAEKHWSLENEVTDKTPVTFIAHCEDDPAVPVENSLRYFNSLKAHKVPVTMHIYPKGGHGFGFLQPEYNMPDPISYCRENLYANLAFWLESIR